MPSEPPDGSPRAKRRCRRTSQSSTLATRATWQKSWPCVAKVHGTSTRHPPRLLSRRTVVRGQNAAANAPAKVQHSPPVVRGITLAVHRTGAWHLNAGLLTRRNTSFAGFLGLHLRLVEQALSAEVAKQWSQRAQYVKPTGPTKSLPKPRFYHCFIIPGRTPASLQAATTRFYYVLQVIPTGQALSRV